MSRSSLFIRIAEIGVLDRSGLVAIGSIEDASALIYESAYLETSQSRVQYVELFWYADIGSFHSISNYLASIPIASIDARLTPTRLPDICQLAYRT